MGEDLLELVKKEVTIGTSPEKVKELMLHKGFLETDIQDALSKAEAETAEYRETKHLVKVFSWKEMFDRVGYGFVPQQFINILFFLTGAGFFWLGIINGARSVISTVLSSMFQEYSKKRQLRKRIISCSGYLYGFSFFGMAAATLLKSVPLFAASLLIGSIGVVSHGDLYQSLKKRQLKREKMNRFLASIAKYGVLITAVCLLVSGWLMDKFPVLGTETIMFMGKSFPLLGYLISFEVTAIAFILSGHMLAHVKDVVDQKKVDRFFRNYIKDMRIYLGTFMRNGSLFLLILTTIIIGLVQVLGNSYYGVFIYQGFKDMAFKGFMNVAVLYFIAVMVSLLGPWFSRSVNKKIGLAPTLVFGTLLVAMTPMAMAFNPNFYAIGAALALSVLGAAIIGVSQGMLVGKLLRVDERRVYFSTASMAAILPFIILLPIGSWYAQMHGLVPLFKILAGVLVIIVAPLYIVLVGMSSKRRL
ncbi:MFS transporter [Nanoarchaeota archaeon]